MDRTGLVLEGGGMKGIYTAGVLEYFLEKGLEFSSVYGVSAGACHMCSFLSKQKGRMKDVAVDYLDSKRYCSVESLVFTGDLFNVDMCYHLIPDYLYPFDHETFEQYTGRAYSVATNIETGRPEYLQLKNLRNDIIKVRASASLPLVSRNVEIDGKLYLDGGMSDAIPLQKSVTDGNRKHVVIMTKEVGYRRKPIDPVPLNLMRVRYLKYPKVTELMANRHEAYNETLDYIEAMRKKGQAFVIRPSKPSNVGRVDKDSAKVERLYEEGYRDAQNCYEDLCKYLNR